MTTLRNQFRSNKNKEQFNIKVVPQKILANLTQLSIAFAVIGFINIWIYLYRINQLNLLTSVISAPSTLLVIFASMSMILILWLILYIIPTIIFTWCASVNDLTDNSHFIVAHSTFISLYLAIFGAYPSETALSVLIFCSVVYISYFIYRHFTASAKNSIIHFIVAFATNVPLIFVLSVIYNKVALSDIPRIYRVCILGLNLIPVYVPLFYAAIILKKNKIIRIKEIFLITALTTGAVAYITLMAMGGLLYKLNDNTMSYVGLRSDEPQWFKVNKEQFPQGWLNTNWQEKNSAGSEVWLKGYPIFQNNTIALICPESTYKAMESYTLSKMTFFSSLPRGSMDSSQCIVIENSPGKVLRPGNMPSPEYEALTADHV